MQHGRLHILAFAVRHQFLEIGKDRLQFIVQRGRRALFRERPHLVKHPRQCKELVDGKPLALQRRAKPLRQSRIQRKRLLHDIVDQFLELRGYLIHRLFLGG